MHVHVGDMEKTVCVKQHLDAYTFGLWRNKDSSIWTMIPGPPRVIVIPKSLVEQTSLSQRYTSTAVPTSTSAAALASVTGYSCDHQNMSISHFCRGNLDLEKKLPSLIDVLVLQLVHRHLTPSDTSFLTLSTMAIPHLYVKTEHLCISDDYTWVVTAIGHHPPPWYSCIVCSFGDKILPIAILRSCK